MAVYDPTEHRALATRFGQDNRVAVLSYRSWALWYLGHPEAAVADSNRALKDAREIGQAASLMYALYHASFTHIFCRNYATADSITDELVALADEKNTLFWKANGMLQRGSLFALTGNASSAIEMITSGVAAFQSTGATAQQIYLAYLARAQAELGRLDDAWRSIGEAMRQAKITKEGLRESDMHRIAGEIALMSSVPNAAKAQAYFERALAVARQQQAKSVELRVAMSMARLLRDQGERRRAHDLLAHVYGWFTEGFDTFDLKEAKALLDEVHA
jgi:predicted ATPase